MRVAIVVAVLLALLACPSARAGQRAEEILKRSRDVTQASMMGVLVIAAVFPSPGAEPYEWWALGCDLAICALLLLVVPRRLPALRFGAGLDESSRRASVQRLATALQETVVGRVLKERMFEAIGRHWRAPSTKRRSAPTRSSKAE